MKIFVIGGAGFIGSHVVDTYIQAGHEVVVLDNFRSGNRQQIHHQAKVYEVDIYRDQEYLESIFENEQPDIVNNHAAQKSVPDSVKDPITDAQINIMGPLHLLELCVQNGVKKFIFSSSGGALASETENIPTTEEGEPQLISPYAISKFILEKYLRFYYLTYGLQYTVLRYANVYGPRQVGEGDCGAIPIFMDNLVNHRPSYLFAYSDMPKGTTRDYVYVEDVAKANLLALHKGNQAILNIGTGQEMYTEDLYELIQEVVMKRIPLIRETERIGDVKRSALDSIKAKNILGWESKTDLKEGLLKTYQWMCNNPTNERV
ncbi:NAD-dependent epimerase/dehydratase family protein [Hazenella coriacea]|uniref:UDP-glucose 4-epimerase n=1 Tax=Hazenella coriacea TaxID=1179467 RepID=A0A4R3L774_9BACL|nr:NAD-dependent epimerase/dehydratase family protein [Hazenella coriacea]TCS94885.1 UDP-glucose 4-epimerase [Hazenella coriacea]